MLKSSSSKEKKGVVENKETIRNKIVSLRSYLVGALNTSREAPTHKVSRQQYSGHLTFLAPLIEGIQPHHGFMYETEESCFIGLAQLKGICPCNSIKRKRSSPIEIRGAPPRQEPHNNLCDIEKRFAYILWSDGLVLGNWTTGVSGFTARKRKKKKIVYIYI